MSARPSAPSCSRPRGRCSPARPARAGAGAPGDRRRLPRVLPVIVAARLLAADDPGRGVPRAARRLDLLRPLWHRGPPCAGTIPWRSARSARTAPRKRPRPDSTETCKEVPIVTESTLTPAAGRWLAPGSSGAGRRAASALPRQVHRSAAAAPATATPASFKTKREAARRAGSGSPASSPRCASPTCACSQRAGAAPDVRRGGDRWQASRIDVAEATKVQHRTALNRRCRLLGEPPASTSSPRCTSPTSLPPSHGDGQGPRVDPQDASRRSRWSSTTRGSARTRPATAVSGCPARRPRSRTRRPPRTSRPSTGCCPRSTGCRSCSSTGPVPASASIDRTLVGDYDEPRRRVRLRKATTKTRQALWIELHPALAEAIEERLAAARGPRPRGAPVRRVRGRRAADLDREGLPGGGDPAVQPARPAPPADLAAAPARRAVGADRRVRRPAQPRRHRRHATRTCSPTSASSTTPSCSPPDGRTCPGRERIVPPPVPPPAPERCRLAGGFDPCPAHANRHVVLSVQTPSTRTRWRVAFGRAHLRDVDRRNGGRGGERGALPRAWPRLRVLLAVPRPARAAGGGPGCAEGVPRKLPPADES